MNKLITEKYISDHLDRLVEEYLTEDLETVYNRYYSEIDREVFNKIIALDPTFNEDADKLGTYGKWLLTRYQKNQLPEEDYALATEILNDFDSRKQFLKNEQSNGEGKEANKGTDINAYKSLQEVRDALDCIVLTDNQRARQERKNKHYADLGEEAIFIGENDKWEVWRPTTQPADAKLGSGSSWCTASSSGEDRGGGPHTGYYYAYTVGENHTDHPNYSSRCWHKYSDDGKLYVFLNKNDKTEKYQARVGDETRTVTDFMNIDDSSVDFVQWVIQEDLLDILMNSELKDTKEIKEIKAYREVIKESEIIVKGIASLYDSLKKGRNKLIIIYKGDEVFIPMISILKSNYIKTIKVISDERSDYDFLSLGRPHFKDSDITLNGVTLDFSDNTKVVRIAGDAFVHLPWVKKIILPSNTKTIESKTFIDCPNLEEVVLPRALEVIEYGAVLDNCNKIKFVKEKGHKIKVTKSEVYFYTSRFINNEPEIEPEVKEESLTEDFGSDVPEWLRGVIKNRSRANDYGHTSNAINSATKNLHITWDNVKIIDVPRDDANYESLCRKYSKEPYIAVYAFSGTYNSNEIKDIVVRDFSSNTIYGGYGRAYWAWKYMNIEECSNKVMYENAIHACYIEKTPEMVQTHTDKIVSRNNNRQDMVKRYDPDSEEGQKAVNSINRSASFDGIGTKLRAYIDKSGYIVNPVELVDELNRYHFKYHSSTLKGYYKRLKECKKYIQKFLSDFDVKEIGYIDNKMNDAVGKLIIASRSYKELVGETEKAMKIKDKQEREQKLKELYLNNSSSCAYLRKRINDLEDFIRQHDMEVVEKLDEK